jgi:hypothetical protein
MSVVEAVWIRVSCSIDFITLFFFRSDWIHGFYSSMEQKSKVADGRGSG